MSILFFRYVHQRIASDGRVHKCSRCFPNVLSTESTQGLYCISDRLAIFLSGILHESGGNLSNILS